MKTVGGESVTLPSEPATPRTAYGARTSSPVDPAGFEPVTRPATVLGLRRGKSAQTSGDGRHAPSETATLPELDIEDRLLVALARRGRLSIDQFIWSATQHRDWRESGWMSDTEYVEALERYGGDHVG